MKSVSIIIPNWNGERQLKKNLPLLFNVLAKFNGESEIIIIDDQSEDGSRGYLKKMRNQKKLRLIFNNKNLGFGGSVNRGVRAARYDIVFLLNTDVEAKTGCFEHILPHFEKKDVFGVGANADWLVGRGQFINGYFDISSPIKIKKTCQEAQPSFWVSGGHSAFRKNLWEKLGGLDPLYAPFYFEETDLCYRAWKRGWKVLLEPKAPVLHKHEESVIRQNFSPRHISSVAQRNQLIFIWKNITDENMFAEHKKALIKRLAKKPSYFKVFLTAAKKWPEIKRKRAIEEKEMVLTDKEIFDKFKMR
ncbi:MAG: glycosyltransferase family 2 protein [Patescibacteria group bacterium]|jgi:GT2 family glycosyltransferase